MSLLHFSHSTALNQWVEDRRKSGETIGFVPTMGALHTGHISLVDRALEHCSTIVVSIFVNPTQFNDPQDLVKYPKTLASDVEMLLKCPCNVVYVPSEVDIYPNGAYKDIWELGAAKEMLEGAFRPGHFDGVLTVVKRLFDLVEPDMAFFGEKDFQQQWLIKRMSESLGNPVKVMSFPTIRESNGLAMSSRNRRLSEVQKDQASGIFAVLKVVKAMKSDKNPGDLEEYAIAQLQLSGEMKVEYFKIVRTDNLESTEIWEGDAAYIALVAIWVGGVRLLDNIFL